jgi:DNA-binding GntR family transcriptional regulator
MARAAPLSVVSKGSLRTEAARVLRDAIFSGRLPQGERLNEAQLSQQLGLSRGPLREAFRQLEEEGLLTSVPHKGTFVARVTSQELVEVLTLRERLEPFAIESALSSNSPALTRKLAAALREMQKSAARRDASALAEAHTEFHSAFYTEAGHKLLETMWVRLEVPLRLYLTLHQQTFPQLDDVAREHERMADLVRRGAKAELAVEIRRHLHVNLKKLLAAVAREEKGA